MLIYLMIMNIFLWWYTGGRVRCKDTVDYIIRFFIFQSHKLLKTHFDRMIYNIILFRVLSAFPDVSVPSNVRAT